MSSQSEDVIALGKKLVAELDLDQSYDTLARWMAHRLAELILAAESASGADRESKMAACSGAVLEIWHHRSDIASGRRPFAEFEAVFRTLEAFDPEQTRSVYYRTTRNAASCDEANSEVGKWLQRADNLDGIARTLIRHCIVSAVANIKDDSREWAQLAKTFLGDDDKDVLVINILNQAVDESSSESPDDAQLARKKGMLEKLESYLVVANDYAESLRIEIERQDTKLQD